jgi:hypothetical protein
MSLSKKNKTNRTRKTNRRQSIKNISVKIGLGNGVNNKIKSKCVDVFLGILNIVKLYHWKTFSYAQHKATDELYSSLNDHMDKFVEIMLGKDDSRLENLSKHLELLNTSSKSEFKNRVYKYRDFLVKLNSMLDKEFDSDLLNVRDELLGDINQFLYLLTFDK